MLCLRQARGCAIIGGLAKPRKTFRRQCSKVYISCMCNVHIAQHELPRPSCAENKCSQIIFLLQHCEINYQFITCKYFVSKQTNPFVSRKVLLKIRIGSNFALSSQFRLIYAFTINFQFRFTSFETTNVLNFSPLSRFSYFRAVCQRPFVMLPARWRRVRSSSDSAQFRPKI